MAQEIFGHPQPLNGTELITIQQKQNGEWAQCSMPLSDVVAYLAAWIAQLPATEPATANSLWNNAGVVSIT